MRLPVFFASLLLLPILAHADYFDPSVSRGATTRTFTSPGGLAEQCIQMKPFPGLQYPEAILKREAKLCTFDFYAADVAICSKNYRTDPGTNIHRVPDGMTREQFETSECIKRKPEAGKKEASFRQSITCDYSPAILAYYPVSQFFHGAGNVEPAVVRTMDLNEHRKITAMGIASTNTDEQKEVHRDWLKYQAIEADVAGYARRQPEHARQLFTKDLQQLYGAIEESVKHTEKDAELSTHGWEAFVRLPSFQALTKATAFDHLTPTLNLETAQTLVQAKDITDMLVLDYLLNQQDRFGNIEALPFYYYRDPAGHVQTEQQLHAKAAEPGTEPDDKQKNAQKQADEMKARGAVLVKEVVLKANECAITKDNLVKQHGLLGMVAHLSAQTYQRALDFQREIDKPAVQSFFQTEALLTREDVNAIRSNAHSLAQLLQSRCRSGSLRLDLDLETFLTEGRLPSDTRALCQ